LSQTLDVLNLIVERLLPPAHQQLFAAAVEDGVVEHLELAELPDELDVTQHLPFGQVFRLLLLRAEFSGSLFVGSGLSRSILELMSAVGEKDSPEGGVLGLGGVKVRCVLGEPFAQLCVHRTILRLIEGFFKHQKNNTFNNCRRIQPTIDNLAAQLFELLGSKLVEDPSNPSEDEVMVVVLREYFSSTGRGGYPSLLLIGAGQVRAAGRTRDSPRLGHASRRGETGNYALLKISAI
jgi:hypothetical protein